MIKRVFLFLVGAGMAISATTASAAVIDIPVTGIGDGYFHNELGTAYDFYNATGNSISAHFQFFGTSDTSSIDIGYAQFSLNSPTFSIADISSVSLNLNIGSSYSAGSSSTAGFLSHRNNSSAANGDASQKLGGDQLVSYVNPGLSGWNSFDVTSFIKNDLMMDYDWAAFSFHGDARGDYANRYSGFNFASAESGSPAYLRVVTNPVPEPETYALMLAGLGLVGFAARKRYRF